MPKATGATPQEGFGPELPGRDPERRAVPMNSLCIKGESDTVMRWSPKR